MNKSLLWLFFFNLQFIIIFITELLLFMCSLRHGPSRLGSRTTQVQMCYQQMPNVSTYVYNKCSCQVPKTVTRVCATTQFMQLPEDLYYSYIFLFVGEYDKLNHQRRDVSPITKTSKIPIPL